jgi:hypothetical protein
LKLFKEETMKISEALIIFVLFLGIPLHAGPCDDKNYMELKEKKISEMSEREYAYFIEKDKVCTKAFEEKAKPAEYTSQFEDEFSHKNPKSEVKVWEVALLLYGAAAVVGAITMIVFINKI